MKKWVVFLAAILAFTLLAATPALAHSDVSISRPSLHHSTYTVGNAISVKGLVTPKRHHLGDYHVVIFIYRKHGNGKYSLHDGSAVDSGAVAGTLYNDGRTHYAASFTLHRTGKFRIRAALAWTDSTGDHHTKWSSFKYFRVVS